MPVKTLALTQNFTFKNLRAAQQLQDIIDDINTRYLEQDYGVRDAAVKMLAALIGVDGLGITGARSINDPRGSLYYVAKLILTTSIETQLEIASEWLCYQQLLGRTRTPSDPGTPPDTGLAV